MPCLSGCWLLFWGATFTCRCRLHLQKEMLDAGARWTGGIRVEEAGKQMKKSLITAVLSTAMMATGIPVLAQTATAPQTGTEGTTQNAPAKAYGHHHRRHHASMGKMMAQKLNLSQQQQDQLKPIFQNQRTQAKAIFQDSSLTQDQKKQKLQALREGTQTQMNAVLTPEQQQQWAQLKAQGKQKMAEHRQQMGARFAQKLNLSAEQQEQLKPIFQKQHEQAKAIWQDSALTQDQKKEKMQALHQDTQAQLNGILSPEQQQQMQQMRQNFRGHRHGQAPATDAQPAPQGA